MKFAIQTGTWIKRRTAMSNVTRLAASVIVLASFNVFSAERDALSAGWNGEKRCENLHEDDQIRVLRCTFPPTIGHERHAHPASFLYVLNGGNGQVTDASGTRDFEVTTDQYRANKPVEWHEAVNTGETTMRYLIIEKKYPTQQ
jgi:quercetin dioxygenase-like cupin family protein